MDFGRLVKIFTAPKDYWNEVIAEPGDIKTLLVPQMLILAAIPALAQFLGVMLGSMTVAMRLGFFGRLMTGAIITLILGYALNIVIWIITGLIINGLAEPFGAQKDASQANKLATGAVIPMWLGSALHIVPFPFLGMLGSLAGLGYGAYFLYLGLPVLNSTPQDKAVGYTAAVIGITFVVAIVLTLVVSCPAGCMMATAMMR
jgi:hypothetical protein